MSSRGHSSGLSRSLLFGTTSYVVPGDVVSNVRILAPLVDDVEIILFEGPESFPSLNEMQAVRLLAEEGGCGFTVHLPLDIGLGDPGGRIRSGAVDVCLRAVSLTECLEPRAFVVHPELPLGYLPSAFPEPLSLEDFGAGERTRWEADLKDSLVRIQAEADPVPLSLENLDYPFEWLDGILSEGRFGVTLDVGHLLKQGNVVEDFVGRYGQCLRVVHLHGVEDGKDHLPVGVLGEDRVGELLRVFRNAGPLVVTLEVFGLPPTVAALEGIATVSVEDAPRLRRAAEVLRAELRNRSGFDG